MDEFHQFPQSAAVAVIGGEEQVVAVRHDRQRRRTTDSGGAVVGGWNAHLLQFRVIFRDFSPLVADHHIVVFGDETQFLIAEGEVRQHALIVGGELAVTIDQFHGSHSGFAFQNGHVAAVHAFGLHGFQLNFAVVVCADRADVGAAATQTDSVNGHIYRAAAGEGLAALQVLVKVDAVAADGCKTHGNPFFLKFLPNLFKHREGKFARKKPRGKAGFVKTIQKISGIPESSPYVLRLSPVSRVLQRLLFLELLQRSLGYSAYRRGT